MPTTLKLMKIVHAFVYTHMYMHVNMQMHVSLYTWICTQTHNHAHNTQFPRNNPTFDQTKFQKCTKVHLLEDAGLVERHLKQLVHKTINKFMKKKKHQHQQNKKKNIVK